MAFELPPVVAPASGVAVASPLGSATGVPNDGIGTRPTYKVGAEVRRILIDPDTRVILTDDAAIGTVRFDARVPAGGSTTPFDFLDDDVLRFTGDAYCVRTAAGGGAGGSAPIYPG